jgi:hypothetical protein
MNLTVDSDHDSVQVLLDQDGNGIFELEMPPDLVIATQELSYANAGWYLFSPPVDLSGQSADSVLQDISQGMAFTWRNSAYVQVDTLRMGQGYWLPVASEMQSTLSGSRKDSLVLHLSAGWHLLGPLSQSMSFADPQDTPDGSIVATFGWDPQNRAYYQTNQLNVGEGYWVAVLQECNLLLKASGGSSVHKSNQTQLWQSFAGRFGEQPPPPPQLDGTGQGAPSLPEDFQLAQNYPNPFNSATNVEFTLGRTEQVSVRIFNVNGQMIRSLVSAPVSAGTHRVIWDGRDERGEQAPTGVYVCRLDAHGFARAIKMLLLR